MKCSLCDQYLNKYDPFENIKESVLFTQVNMQEICLIIWHCAECNKMYIYRCHIYYICIFYHVGDKEIIKQRIP